MRRRARNESRDADRPPPSRCAPMTRLMLRLLACIPLMVAVGTPAASPTTVSVEELTWTELRSEVRAGKTTLVRGDGWILRRGAEKEKLEPGKLIKGDDL